STTPTAFTATVFGDELIAEANPYCCLASISALVFHGLSYQFPRSTVAVYPRPRSADLLPLDTTDSDWIGEAEPPIRLPGEVDHMRLIWHEIPARRFYGITEYRHFGYPIRVMDLERTLLDALLQPDECFGLDDVLSAWGRSSERLEVDTIVRYVERLDEPTIRQQAGYLLEEMHLSHPRFDIWAAAARRAATGRLGDLSDNHAYSERWNLLVSAPMGALYEYVA
ncbi:MAG: type IV toxin-antitoxin system AbiEi family antitoxin domain-containing protein, partial [Dehalococcoidia bacterium]